MFIYKNYFSDEMMVRDVAIKRILKNLTSDDIMSYLSDNMDWSTLANVLPEDFKMALMDEVAENRLDEDFEAFYLIESE